MCSSDLKKEWDEAVKLGLEASRKVYEIQKKALNEKYEKIAKEASQ